MRSDSIGMFWEDIPQKRSNRDVVRPMPPIPDTGWTPPKDFPNLRNAPVISLDTETYDPELKEHGPGWARGKGHIVGVSLAVPGQAWYFPVRHEVQSEMNMDPDRVFAYLRDTLALPMPKVGANIVYDLGWLEEEKVIVHGDIFDVQYAEALLHESETVSVDDLGERYLGRGKDVSLLYQWCSDFYGGSLSDQRKNIYRAPPSLVGFYAERDAEIPLSVAELQFPKLHSQQLMDLYSIECRLIRLMVKMRQTGVRVDLQRAEEVHAVLRAKQLEKKLELKAMVGREINVNAADSLKYAFDKFGLAYPVTQKTKKPSFKAEFLQALDHPIGEIIRDIRKYDKICGTFIESYILGSHVNGRIHCQFHQLRGEGDGTRSGRFSSSDPNLQNIPSRDEELAPLMRSMFVPDFGHRYWRKYDYSQIEYRKLVHFAIGPGSEEARRQYRDNPKTDYHEWTLDLVAPKANWDISTKEKRKHRRKPVKNINFGLIFGMGIAKLGRSLGLNEKESRALFDAYHEGVPFAKPTMDFCSEFVEQHGYITTILGRRSRFDLWEPAHTSRGEERLPGLPLDLALKMYGHRIKRAYLHKALNRRLQGSAADLMKKAMLDCFEMGIFDATGIPKLTVHDELDFSDPGGCDEAFAEMHHVLETAIPISIPIIAEGDIGPNWGDLRPIA